MTVTYRDEVSMRQVQGGIGFTGNLRWREGVPREGDERMDE